MGGCLYRSSNQIVIEPVEIQKILEENNGVDEAALRSDAKNDSYNTVVWYNDPLLLSMYFGEPTVSVIPVGQNIVMNFSFFMITITQLHTVPTVIDCLVLLTDNMEAAKEEISDLLNHFHYVLNKKVLFPEFSPEVSTYYTQMNLTVCAELNGLYRAIYTDDNTINSLILEVFNRIDTDHSGHIDLKEMANAAKQLGQEIPMEELKSAIDEMDLNNDGVIHYKEFLYWWKRGKQGAKSVNKLASKWAQKLSSRIPGSIELLKSVKIKKGALKRKTLLKTLKLSIDAQEPNLKIDFFLGKSAKKEQCIEEVKNIMNFGLKYFWVTAACKLNGSISEEVMENIRKLISAQINSGTAASYDDLNDMIGFDLKTERNTLFLGFWAELDHPKLSEAVSELQILDELLKTPVDDYFKFSSRFNAGIEDLLYKDGLQGIIKPGMTMEIELEHWEKLADVFANLSESKALIYALLLSGVTNIKYNDYDQIPYEIKRMIELRPNPIRGLFEALRLVLVSMPLLKRATFAVLENIQSSLEVYGRYNNFGFKFSIESPILSYSLLSFFNK